MLLELLAGKIFTTKTSILGQNISEHYSRILQKRFNTPIPQIASTIIKLFFQKTSPVFIPNRPEKRGRRNHLILLPLPEHN
jgi:hypothetical protein